MASKYTLIVGTKVWSSWSLRPYLALVATAQPFSEEVIALRHDTTPAEIRARSPSGKVPALMIVEEGKTHVVWDSLAICETLAERHPEAGLWPEDGATRAVARSYAAEMHSGFPDLRDQLSMAFGQRRPMPELRDATKAQIARIVQAWSEALAQHGDGGGFLFGRFSIADCMYAPVVSRFLTYGVELPEPIETYASRIMALPGMRSWGATTSVNAPGHL